MRREGKPHIVRRWGLWWCTVVEVEWLTGRPHTRAMAGGKTPLEAYVLCVGGR